MLSDYKSFEKIYIACGYTDLRRGLDGLANLVQNQFNLNPFQKNVLFMFCGRRSNKMKCLVWEGDGFLLLYKRLEDGRFRWPRTQEEVLSISQQQLEWLLTGLNIEPSIRSVTPKSVL